MDFTATSLQRLLHKQVPLTRQMGVTVAQLHRDAIELHAPLSVNHNHNGTAFGGSLASLMTLSGWSLLLVRLQAAGIDADLMIQKQQLTYRRPVTGALTSHCVLDDTQQWDDFIEMLNRRRRARIGLNAWTGAADNPAATMEAHYVALMRNP